MKENAELNRVEQMQENLKADFAEHKKAFIGAFIGIILASIVISSFLTQYFKNLFNINGGYYFSGLFTETFSNPISVVLLILIIWLLCRGCYRGRLLLKKDYEKVDEDDEIYKRATDSQIYGSAMWMPERQKKETFQRSKNFDDISNDILGYDKNGYIYAINDPNIPNLNKIVFGSAGSGKSVSVVYNDIIQAIRRGESIIATDSKGDVYANTVQIAKNHGYIIRVLNLKAKELRNSDAWEPLKYITEEDAIQAEVLANAIIENTMEGARKDYWSTNEQNCLKAAILLVATTPMYEGRRTMGEVVNIVSDPTTYDSKFAGLPNDNPAKQAFNIYAACEPKVKGQILNGMANRLALLTNKYVKEIVSHDEIDLVLPMRRKCIYYIIISDTDTTMKFVASMFFSQIFMVQCDYSDSLSKEEKDKQLPVRYELDEFKNIGSIPYFDIKIATFRSRKITSTIILQNLTQLQEMYPHGAHNAILSNTATHILLRAFDIETAEYFEKMCGTVTVIVEGTRFTKGRTQILDLHNDEKMNNGFGKRSLLMPDAAMRLDAETLVICIAGKYPIKLKKYRTYKFNPIYLKEYVEKKPNKHRPKWRKAQEEERAMLEAKYGDNSEAPAKVTTPAPTVTDNYVPDAFDMAQQEKQEKKELVAPTVPTPEPVQAPRPQTPPKPKPEQQKQEPKSKPKPEPKKAPEDNESNINSKGALMMEDLFNGE